MALNHTSAKAKLFNLYRSQMVFKLLGLGHTYENPMPEIYDDVYLQLRSIADLKDEECIRLATIVIEEPFNRYQRIEVSRDFKITGFPYIMVHHKNIRYKFQIDCTHFNFDVIDMDEIAKYIDMKPYACIDYLRSIAIALPFTVLEDGKPRTYSVEEMVGNKWVVVNGE